MTLRVADFISEHLKAIGVKKAFLLSGGGMMHLVDAVGVSGLSYVCCHHEQACAMAAEGYARELGKIGVCYATSGPGATNILTGLVGAWQDSSPVLFLTGQSKRSQTIRLARNKGLRQFGTFEVDILPMVQSVTKYAHFVDDPATIRYHLEKAIYLATNGRPGPVLLDIPLDVQGALIEADHMPGFSVPEEASSPDVVSVERIFEELNSANRPVLLVGHGIRCAAAATNFRILVDSLEIPVISTQLAKDVLPYDHRCFVGHCGPKGDRPGNFAIQSADLILSLGCSLHPQTIGYEVELFAPAARKIQVDLDESILKRGDIPVHIQVKQDVSLFISTLTRKAKESPRLANHAKWLDQCSTWKRQYMVRAEPHDVSTEEINFYEFAEVLSEALDANASIVTDAGSAFYVMGQAFRCKEGQRYIVSGAMGSMGYALPAAIGMSCAAPDRTIVCVTGDGSLQANIQELQTIKHYALNIKLFVLINEGYASIRNTQIGFFSGRVVGASRESGVSMPVLQKIASAYDLPYVGIDGRPEFLKLVSKVLSMSGPVICGIRSQPKQQIIPTVSSSKMPNGSLRSDPLHVMAPYLPQAELINILGGQIPSPSSS